MSVKELDEQLESLKSHLKEAEARHDQVKLEMKKGAYLARTGRQDPKDQESLDGLWTEAQGLDREKEELSVAISEAEERLKAAKEKQRKREVEEQKQALKTKVDLWLKQSKELDKTIARLANQMRKYNEIKGEVSQAALPLTGRWSALERRSTVANHVHFGLSRVDPANFVWISQKLAPGLSLVDGQIVEALLGRASTESRPLPQIEGPLEENLAQQVIEKNRSKAEAIK